MHRLFVPPLLLAMVASSGVFGADTSTVADSGARLTKTGVGQATGDWAVHLAPGADPASAAAEFGAISFEPVGNLKDVYLFRMPESAGDASKKAAPRIGPGILWHEEQVARQRYRRLPTDPLFVSQWHLNNTGQTGGTSGQDANVVAAWNLGYTGSGVTIGVVDDGLQHSHPDLTANYSAALSWDFNGNDADPTPTSTLDDHGTAVAGVAAARDDGSSCGVGVAYRAQLAGLRLIAAPNTDADEANALSHEDQNIHIYSNSWGPNDDGATLEGPGTLTRAAIADSIANGRGGRGSLYVWAGGNGNGAYDNTNYDGYANSRYVIAVAAVDHNGIQSYYSEPGAPLLVTAPSNGELVGITTTDLLGTSGSNTSASPTGDCRNDFGGTSSATPLVSGVVALMLQANPNLGWRDVRHILLGTATRNHTSDSDWAMNGGERWVNHKYGYGRVNAGSAVTAAAKRARNLGPESVVDGGTRNPGLAIPDNTAGGVSDSVALTGNMIVESVEVVFSATHTYRGDLRVTLTSPSGTQSVLADEHNDGTNNYSSWTFTSARHWGELSAGTWTLRVEDLASIDTGTFTSWRLVLHGRQPIFSDVGTTHPLWRGVEAFYQGGITNGCATGLFCPDASTTRAQMAVFLERVNRGATYAPPACAGSMFSDVNNMTFACDWIEQLARDGITIGCGGGQYCPDQAVSRAQMAIFLLRTKHGSSYAPPTCTGTLFSDVPASHYACNWIEQLYAEGITTGCGSGQYCPEQTLTRAQMATMVTRAFALVKP